MKAPVTAPHSVLVYVGGDLVGDGLMKLPFVRTLRATYPKAKITWLAGKSRTVYAGSLAPLVAGLIDAVIDDAGIGSDWQELFDRPLGGRRFDLVLDTQRRVLTTLIVRRIAHGAFVSGAAGFRFSDLRPSGGPVKPPGMVRQMLRLIEAASGRRPALPDGSVPLPAGCRRDVGHLMPGDGAPLLGLAPGAGGRGKRWPLDRYLALAAQNQALGRTVVLLLGPDERDMVETVRNRLPGATLPLQEAEDKGIEVTPILTIALAQRLDAAVANDAGVGHMLAAAGCPLVSLFGPTDPAKFAPVSRRLTVVTAQEFGAREMDAIPVTAVAAAVENLLR